VGEVFNVTHNGGSLAEYDATVTDGGDLSADAAAAMAGSGYGLRAVIDDTSALYGRVDFSLSSSEFRYRFYFDPNGVSMGNGDEFRLVDFCDSGSIRQFVDVEYSGGAYNIRAQIVDDGGGWDTTGNQAITDAPHYIEVLVEYASSSVASDGRVTLWIDGVQEAQVTGLDIYDVSKPDQARMGAAQGLEATTSGTIYLDEFVLRDDDTAIGPASYGGSVPPVAAHQYRLRRVA